VGRDEALERLSRQYLALPERNRTAFVTIMDAAAKVLAD
jgi:hypothetical protein